MTQPREPGRVNIAMRIQSVQIIAGLLCAVAFVIAFMAAGVAVVSFAFALLGAVALAWLVYSVAKRLLSHREARELTHRS